MITGCLTKKLRGNTILEVLIALAVTSFCVGLACIIYLNIQKSSLPFFKIKAIELGELCLDETIRRRTFFEETATNEEFTIKKTVSPHEIFSDCYVVRVIIFDGSRKKIHETEVTLHR